jgi:hypothetical protein
MRTTIDGGVLLRRKAEGLVQSGQALLLAGLERRVGDDGIVRPDSTELGVGVVRPTQDLVDVAVASRRDLGNWQGNQSRRSVAVYGRTDGF